MFSSCKKLKQLDVSNFHTKNGKEFSLMFSNCMDLTSLDVSNFETDKATFMDGMFLIVLHLKI